MSKGGPHATCDTVSFSITHRSFFSNSLSVIRFLHFSALILINQHHALSAVTSYMRGQCTLKRLCINVAIRRESCQANWQYASRLCVVGCR